MRTRAQFLTVVTAVLVLGAAGVAAAFFFTRPQALATTEVGSYVGQPTLGEPDAPVKLILFENFMCDHCRAFETDVFPQLKREYIDTGEVQAIYVNLAWGEEEAELAALAGECAYRQSETAFWDFKGQLYQAQGRWQTVADLEALAEAVPELDSAELRQCTRQAETQSEVDRDLALADYVGVSGTPSLVIGNQGYEAPSFETLQAAIEAQGAEN